MRSIIIESTGRELRIKATSKWNRRFFGVPKIEQSWSGPEHRVYKTGGQLDREAELLFERWAGNLNEIICLDDSDEPARSVYEWGKELAELEETVMELDDPRIIRMHLIARMLINARLIWRGGPSWWREL